VDKAETLALCTDAQHAVVFRRLLWNRLAVMTIVWAIASWAIPLSRAAFVMGVVMLAVAALWARSLERRILNRLLSSQK
jgi:hypothetical protein